MNKEEIEKIVKILETYTILRWYEGKLLFNRKTNIVTIIKVIVP